VYGVIRKQRNFLQDVHWALDLHSHFLREYNFSTLVYPLFAEKLQDNTLAVETRTFQMMFGNIQVKCCDFLRLEEQSFQSFYISFPAMLKRDISFPAVPSLPDRADSDLAGRLGSTQQIDLLCF
jgi:hypothetical protein